jgi:2-methylcitrate dehydratase PrpD
MTNNPTRGLAEKVTSAAFKTIGSDIELRARELLLDYLGVLIGGSVEPVGVSMGRYPETSPSDESSIYLKKRSTAAGAAMANGMAAHTLELDDVTNESSLHSGVVV